MTNVILINRQRTRERTRPRPNARGNFVTLRNFATVFSLTFNPTDAHYIKWQPYIFPSTKAIGFIDDPPPVPTLQPVGPVANIQTVPQFTGILPGAEPILPTIPGFEPTPIETIPTPIPLPTPGNLPEGTQPVQQIGFQGGDAFQVIAQLIRQQIFTSTLNTKQVFLKAKSSNGGSIWIGFKETVAVDNGWELEAGEGIVINLSDISQIYFIAAVANDKMQVMYFV